MGAKSGQKRKSSPARGSGRQRFALVSFGALLILLFVILAVAEGIGAPSVPTGDIATVEGVPSNLEDVSEAKYDRVFDQQVAGAKLKKAPKPGTAKYEELQDTAVEELINAVWLQGEADELGVVVTDKQVTAELDKIKKENFPSEAAFDKFIDEQHLVQADAVERVKLQLLGTAVQEKVKEEAPEPSSEAIERFYEEEKSARFEQKESRDVRFVVNKDRAKVEAAKKLLEQDHSPAGWQKAAAKYTTDPTTKSKGGLQEGIQEEFLQEPIKAAIFDAATGELVGPVEYEKSSFVIEVVKLNPAKTKSLKEAEPEIKATLEQELQQEYFSEWVAGYESKWTSRTHCVDGFLTKQCSNFTGSGHPSSAPPACYEADPQVPAQACPAPVPLTQPALPGTVTLQKPKGEPFVQRPLPESGEEAGAAVPGGAVPPEGAAPPAEGSTPPPAESGGAAKPSGE